MRHCITETETLAHVAGSCPHGSFYEKKDITLFDLQLLKSCRKESREEIHCIRNSRSTAGVVLLAWNATSNKGYILNPTVWFETSVGNPNEVDEKKTIYKPTISYFKETSHLKEIKVYGLSIPRNNT